jgi:uncharacterized membrane protein
MDFFKLHFMHIDKLGPWHPQITHGPVVLLIIGALFEIVGRLLDRDWMRKAAFAMLILGVVAAWLSVVSGHPAGEIAEHRQGVPESAIDAHEDMAVITLWLGIGALVVQAIAGLFGAARGGIGVVGMLLYVAAAVTVGIAAHRGGKLVFDHAANVRLHGQLLQVGTPEAHERGGAKGKRR